MRRILYRLHLLHSPSREMLGKCWCQKKRPCTLAEHLDAVYSATACRCQNDA